jgi:solute:Na+ symporter, SSS family
MDHRIDLLLLVVRATAMFMGLCAAVFLPAFAIGVYVKQPSTRAAIASMVSGAVVWFLWTAFIHTAEAEPLGLCQEIFGKPALFSLPWSVIDPLVIALPVSFVVMIVLQKR